MFRVFTEFTVLVACLTFADEFRRYLVMNKMTYDYTYDDEVKDEDHCYYDSSYGGDMWHYKKTQDH